MANPVAIPITTKYDDKGFRQLQADAKKAAQQEFRRRQIAKREDIAVIRGLKQEIAAKRRLGNLSRKLAREQERERKAAQRAGQRRLAQLKKIAREAEREEKAAKRAAAARRRQAKEIATGLAAGTAVLATFALKAFEAAAASERLETATESLGRRFGVTGDQIADSIQEISQNTISRTDAMKAANKAMLLGVIQSEEQFAELTEIAISLGRAVGQDATKSIEDMTIGLGRQSPRILDNLGLIISTEAAYQKFAVSIGKVASELTEAERKQAFINEALRIGQEMTDELGNATLDTAGKIERMQARTADLTVELGKLVTDVGLLDFLDATEVKLIRGAKAWQGIAADIKTVVAGLDRASKSGEEFNVEVTGLFTLGQRIGQLAVRFAGTDKESLANALAEVAAEAAAAEQAAEDLARRNEQLARATELAAAAAAKLAAETAAAAAEEEKRLEKVAEIRHDTIKKLIEIDERAREATAEANKQFKKDTERLEKEHGKRMASIRRDAAKAIAKSFADEDKAVRRLQEDAATSQKRKDRTRRIDTAGDERLFQFELRNLAAEGDAIAIEQALERREIEQQIAEEKVAAEDQVEADRSKVQIERLKEDAAERRSELRAEREQALADETISFQERSEELKLFHAEKLADIEKNKEDAIKKLGEELAEMGVLTATELGELAVIAGQLGKGIGENLAEGIQDGFALNERISDLLGIAPGGGVAPPAPVGPTPSPGAPILTPLQQTQGVQFGGSFVVGGSGGPDSQLVQLRATPGELITATPPGQGANITINASGVGIKQLVAILEGKVNEGLQEYTDTILAPALGGS